MRQRMCTAERYGNTKTEKKAVCFGWFFTGTDVFLDGAYDVELASAIFLCGKSSGDGTASAAFDGHYHGSSTRNSLSVVLKDC